MNGFGALFQRFRLRAGLTQAQLADAAKVNPGTIASWESGRRNPRRTALTSAAEALGLNADETNALLEAVGLDPVPGNLLDPFISRRRPLARLREECASYAWPCLVMSEHWEIIGWNAAANAIAELDFATDLGEPGARSLLRMALTPHFRARLLNWDEVIGLLVGMIKAANADPGGDSGAGLNALMEHVVERYPEMLPKLFELWQTAREWREGVRMAFPVRWRTGDGELVNFDCALTAWSDFDAAWAFDWHPADAKTWEWLNGHARPLTQLPETESASEPVRWRRLLREARTAKKLSRFDAATLAGLHEETVYAYEAGRRSPSRESLLRLCQALAIDGATTNLVLSAAGFAPQPSPWAQFASGQASVGYYESAKPVRRFTADEIAEAIEEHVWPTFVVNGRCEVVMANRASDWLLGFKLSSIPQGIGRNLVCLVTEAGFRSRATDWTQMVTSILPGELEPLIRGQEPGKEGEYFRRVVKLVQARDEAAGDRDGALRALFEAWRERPVREFAVRVCFGFGWRSPYETLEFNAIVSPWNTFEGYWSIDLHPADGATWRSLGARGGSALPT